jgi:mRNA-degrading endonuclease RelE of RelBE toxin-antitoxin system
MDKLQKALGKLSQKERGSIKEALALLQSDRTETLDMKKLKGRDDIYRIRKGAVRIIFRRDEKGKIFILAIERRSDTTYNFKE